MTEVMTTTTRAEASTTRIAKKARPTTTDLDLTKIQQEATM